MSIVSKALGYGVKAVRPVVSEVTQNAGKVVNPILKKVQETFGSVLLKGVRGDIAVISRGVTSDSPTIFARIMKDGSLQPLKTKVLCKPSLRLENENIWRRRIDYNMTKTLDGQQVQKTIFNDRVYNRHRLAKKSRLVVYYAPNATNGHYTGRLPYTSRAEYDIANGKYFKSIEATSRPTRMVGESGTLAYNNGHLTTNRTELWTINPNLRGDDIRRKVGTSGFLNPKFM